MATSQSAWPTPASASTGAHRRHRVAWPTSATSAPAYGDRAQLSVTEIGGDPTATITVPYVSKPAGCHVMTARRTLFAVRAPPRRCGASHSALALGASGAASTSSSTSRTWSSHLGTGHGLLGLAIAACVLGIVLPAGAGAGVVLPLAVVAGAVLLIGALLLGAGALALAPLAAVAARALAVAAFAAPPRAPALP